VSLAGEERKKSIMTLLNEQGKVNVSELSQKFEVSTETIRRDLDELEKENKLKKVYGGAIRYKAEIEPPHVERESLHTDAKRKIGSLAAQLIDNNDFILIDEGSTALQIIHHLEDKRHLTILTCSIPALTLLIEYQKRGSFDGKIIFIGGEVSAKHMRVSGSIAEKTLDDFYVNKAFVSVDGISLEHGITSYDYDKANFTRKMISCSETTIVLADHSKIDKRSVSKIAELAEVDQIISDQAPPSHWVTSFAAMNVQWVDSKGTA
jgi:DeoR/GlpR family transcriptional regulator of sugar metabolism